MTSQASQQKRTADELKPNRKFDHVFVIVRLDEPAIADEVVESLVTIQKVVWSKLTAESEVSRLNKLNAGKGARYFWQVARIERSTEGEKLD